MMACKARMSVSGQNDGIALAFTGFLVIRLIADFCMEDVPIIFFLSTGG
jgi:hypothetical protein